MKSFTKTALFIVGVIGATTAQAAPPLNHIVANWHFDEGRGQKTLDLSGYGKNGQLGASSSKDSADPLWVSRRFDNAALSFDGSKFVKVAHAANLEPEKVSVEAWVKLGVQVETSLPVVVAKSGDACHYAAYALYFHDDLSGNQSVPYFYVTNFDGTESDYKESPEGAPSLSDGKWHHLVGTYDLEAVRLYVDGNQVGTGTATTAPITYSHFTNKDLYIGDYDGDSGICNDYNGYFVGDIDEVRIWDKALTGTEITKRYKGY